VADQTPHPTCWLPECPHPATPRGTNPHACWSHQPDDSVRYPVIVTYTEEHVVWVEADSLEEAVKRACRDPWELTHRDSTLASLSTDVRAPKPWDYDYTVYDEGETYEGLPCDAHVKVWEDRQRKAAQAACAEAGHPNPAENRGRPGTFYCPTCYVGVDAPEAVTSDAR
jgi:hypothetical protein